MYRIEIFDEFRESEPDTKLVRFFYELILSSQGAIKSLTLG